MTTDLDLSARYRIKGYGGIAWFLRGYAKELTEESWEYCGKGDEEDEANYLYNEPEEVENRDKVIAVMVGDDRPFEVDVEDLVILDDLDYCHVCGQIGCTHDGYDR